MTGKRVLYTTSCEDIIESISNICNCRPGDINTHIKRSRPFKNVFPADIKLSLFFKEIGVLFKSNIELFEIIKFDFCTISHLTTRISPPDKSDIYCLIEVLSKATDFSRFLSSKGITFAKRAHDLAAYYNNKKVDWDKFDSHAIYRIKKRLRINGKYIDNCINGFLFNYLFWEDSNVEHIKNCPEIVTDICHVLNRHDIINEWSNISTTYALGFLADVNDIIFDGYIKHVTTKSKIYLLYKYAIYFLIQHYHGVWDARFDNPIICLKDNYSVNKKNIIGYYEIER